MHAALLSEIERIKDDFEDHAKIMPGPTRSSKPTVIDDRYPARKPGHEPGSFTLSFSAIACTRNIFTVSCMKNVKSDFDSFIKSPLHRWKVLYPVLLGKCPANRYLLSHSSTPGIRWKPSKISVGSFNRETFCHLDSKYRDASKLLLSFIDENSRNVANRKNF